MRFVLTITLFVFVSSCALIGSKNDGHDSNQDQGYLGEIRQRLIDNISNLRYCYEKHGKEPNKKTPTSGEVALVFKVLKTGSVDSVQVKQVGIQNLGIRGCVVKVISNIQFPPHGNARPVEVRQSFNFSVKNQKSGTKKKKS
jgi:hypothetical protein